MKYVEKIPHTISYNVVKMTKFGKIKYKASVTTRNANSPFQTFMRYVQHVRWVLGSRGTFQDFQKLHIKL